MDPLEHSEKTKREVVCIYVFYVDVFFLQNLIMNGMILLLMVYMEGGFLLGFWKKILLISITMTVLEVILLLFGKNYVFYTIFSFLVVLPGMILWCFGRSSPVFFLKRYLLAVFETFLLGGIVQGIVNLTGWQESNVWIGIGAGGIGFGLSQVVFARWKKGRHMYSVGLFLGDKKIWIKGLYDSGNRLVTEHKKEPIHIVDGEILKKLGITEETPFFYQMFSSLGNSQGIVKVYEMDEMVIQRKTPKSYGKVWVAEEAQGILRGKEYQIILNAAIEEEILQNN